MELQRLVFEKETELNELDLDILNYVLNHQQEVQTLGIMQLADVTHASKSSILRMTKKLGFSGYSEFKYFLRHKVNQETIQIQQETNIFDQQLEDIQRTIADLHQSNIQPILELLHQSQTIYCFATGFIQKIALDEFYTRMLSLNKRTLVLPNKTELDMVMPMVSEKDCVIVASLSGETEEIKPNLLSLEMRHIPVISLTATGDNYFARHSHAHLHYYSDFFPLGKEGTPAQSLIGLHCVTDYLYRAYNEFLRTE